MYKLPYYIEDDQKKVTQFIRDNYFAAVIGWDDNYPVATQVPLDIEEKDGKLKFSGHMMKNTDHHKAFSKNDKVMVLFTGPHTYVSASWYTDPRQGSTWNYMTVQAKGTISFLDQDATRQAVKKITDQHEGNSPAGFDQLAEDYVSNLVKAIAAFEIHVHSLENVFKLSQNRDRPSQENIIRQLLANKTDNATAIARAMQERLL